MIMLYLVCCCCVWLSCLSSGGCVCWVVLILCLILRFLYFLIISIFCMVWVL